MTKPAILFSVLGLALVACNSDLEGVLQSSQNIPVKDKKGKMQSIPAGTRKAKLGLEDDGKVLKVKFNDDAGKERKIEMTVPQDSIPVNAQFHVKGQATGQSFDLDGLIKKDVVVSERIRQNQQCTYQTQEWRCYTVPVHHPDGSTTYEQRCEYVPVTRYGWRMVEYHTETTTIDAEVMFNDSVNTANLGRFDGKDAFRQDILDWQGPCY
jgi:hypothetical protein